MQLSSGVASVVAAGAATSHSESVNVASFALIHDGICVRVCVYRIASCAAPSCRVASFCRVQARAESGGCLAAVPQTFRPPRSWALGWCSSAMARRGGGRPDARRATVGTATPTAGRRAIRDRISQVRQERKRYGSGRQQHTMPALARVVEVE